MKPLASISKLPSVPAVYAMFGGQGTSSYVAYVGLGSNLKQRITQHLIRRDSSVVTGVSAVSLNPDLITEVRWWENPDFGSADILEAAELVAFDVLNPALRSRGAVTARARQLHADEEFHSRMKALFLSPASGSLVIPSLQQALAKISELELRMDALERKQ